jgi:hypothetical protein
MQGNQKEKSLNNTSRVADEQNKTIFLNNPSQKLPYFFKINITIADEHESCFFILTENKTILCIQTWKGNITVP